MFGLVVGRFFIEVVIIFMLLGVMFIWVVKMIVLGIGFLVCLLISLMVILVCGLCFILEVMGWNL